MYAYLLAYIHIFAIKRKEMNEILQVKEVLRRKKMTQKELAARLDIHPVTLSSMLTGNPTLDTLQRIASAIEVEVIDLIVDNRPLHIYQHTNSAVCPHCNNSIKIELTK